MSLSSLKSTKHTNRLIQLKNIEKKEDKDEVEYKEPNQEFVDDFKLKIKDESNKGTELKEV